MKREQHKKKAKRPNQVNFVLPADLFQALRKRSFETSLTKTSITEKAIRAYLATK